MEERTKYQPLQPEERMIPGVIPVVRAAQFYGDAMFFDGRLGEVADGRFVDFDFAEIGFGGPAATEKADRRQRAQRVSSGN